jgi:molybdopterin/thiamine biosynthesis adenylyltransferase
MDDHDLLRYSRHILLEEFGIDGQARVSAGRALVIGAGGLGSPVALYLAAAGVGHITLVDDDEVDLTNLQRQVAHTNARVGSPKVESAAEAMRGINPDIAIETHALRADEALLSRLVARPTWWSIAATTSPRAMRSTGPAWRMASRWWQVPPSASTAS